MTDITAQLYTSRPETRDTPVHNRTEEKKSKENKIKIVHRSNVQEACTTTRGYKQQQFITARTESTNKCGAYKNM
jgi:hypothetical protein